MLVVTFSTFRASSIVIATYDAEGKYAQAEADYNEVLQIALRTLGPQSPLRGSAVRQRDCRRYERFSDLSNVSSQSTTPQGP